MSILLFHFFYWPLFLLTILISKCIVFIWFKITGTRATRELFCLPNQNSVPRTSDESWFSSFQDKRCYLLTWDTWLIYYSWVFVRHSNFNAYCISPVQIHVTLEESEGYLTLGFQFRHLSLHRKQSKCDFEHSVYWLSF